jgi:hypothetical protein
VKLRNPKRITLSIINTSHIHIKVDTVRERFINNHSRDLLASNELDIEAGTLSLRAKLVYTMTPIGRQQLAEIVVWLRTMRVEPNSSTMNWGCLLLKTTALLCWPRLNLFALV